MAASTACFSSSVTIEDQETKMKAAEHRRGMNTQRRVKSLQASEAAQIQTGRQNKGDVE